MRDLLEAIHRYTTASERHIVSMAGMVHVAEQKDAAATEAAAALDAIINARLERIVPEIVATVRARKWDGRPCCTCGHVASRHSEAVGCIGINGETCECMAFTTTEAK